MVADLMGLGLLIPWGRVGVADLMGLGWGWLLTPLGWGWGC